MGWPTETLIGRYPAEGSPSVGRQRTPHKAYRDIIRVWGLLNTYRPTSHTSWSKALVLHGADSAVALAEVLGGERRGHSGVGLPQAAQPWRAAIPNAPSKLSPFSR